MEFYLDLHLVGKLLYQMKLKLLLLLLLLWSHDYKLNAQVPREIIRITQYIDSVTFDTSLYWYAQVFEENSHGGKRQHFVLIEPGEAIIQEKMNDYYELSLDTFPGVGYGASLIIGFDDTLSKRYVPQLKFNYTYPHINKSYPVLTQPIIRDLSPYIDIKLTGTIELKNFDFECTEYGIYVTCIFSEYAYHKPDTLNGRATSGMHSFVQDLTSDVEKLLKANATSLKVHQTYPVLCGYFDNDHLLDYVFRSARHYYVLSSKDFSFQEKRIYTIVHSWRDRWEYSFF